MTILYQFTLCLTRKINLRAKKSYVSVVIQRFKSERMKFLNVAEKNDAAKNIALHLSRGTSQRVLKKTRYHNN